MDRVYYFPQQQYGTGPPTPLMEPPYPVYMTGGQFVNDQHTPLMNINVLSYHQQICNTDLPSPSVLQTLLKKDDHHSPMQMDVSPSTSNIPVSMLNGSRGLQMTQQQFVAVKNEPASTNCAPNMYMAVKNELTTNFGVNKMCAKFEPDSPTTTMMMGVDEKPYICAGCNCRIVDRYLLKAVDKIWHEACLRCNECGCQLTEKNKSLFVKNNKIYCRHDYGRLFGVKGKCSACHNIIPPLEMIMRAGGNVYHLNCFACQECNHRFCVGDKFYFDFDNNKILCENDYNERMYFAGLSNCNSPFYLAQLKRQISYQVDDLDEISPMQR